MTLLRFIVQKATCYTSTPSPTPAHIILVEIAAAYIFFLPKGVSKDIIESYISFCLPAWNLIKFKQTEKVDTLVECFPK